MNRNIGTATRRRRRRPAGASMSVFTVDQRQNAIVARLGEVVSMQDRAGPVLQGAAARSRRLFDTRILTIDTEGPERFLTSEKKNVLVDSFVKWRDHRRAQYYVSRPGRFEAARPPDPDRERRAPRGVRQAHRARRGLGRARQDHEHVMRRQGGRRRPQDRRRGRRRAPEAGRPRAAGSQRIGLPPDGGGEEARRERAALDRLGRGREDQAPTPIARSRSSSPRPIATRSASRARATPRPPDLRRGLRANRSSTLLPQPGGVPLQLPQQVSDVLVLDPSSSEFFKYMKNPGRGK
jgi:membrane protease subunit HflC